MVLDAALLNFQHYKVLIKGKVEQSRERSSFLPYTVITIEKGAFGPPSTKVANFIYSKVKKKKTSLKFSKSTNSTISIFFLPSNIWLALVHYLFNRSSAENPSLRQICPFGKMFPPVKYLHSAFRLTHSYPIVN